MISFIKNLFKDDIKPLKLHETGPFPIVCDSMTISQLPSGKMIVRYYQNGNCLLESEERKIDFASGEVYSLANVRIKFTLTTTLE